MIGQGDYDTVTVVPADGAFIVLLDEKPLRSPAGALLRLPTLALAQAVAEEWRAQGKAIDPLAMPQFRLAVTAIDRVRVEREAVLDRLAAYAETDLLCFRVSAPAELVARQVAAYQPALDWLAARFGVTLAVTSELRGPPHPSGARAGLRAAIEGRDDFTLGALQALTIDLGSVALALAVAEGALSAEAVLAVSLTEETYQNERWGFDAVAEAKRERLLQDVAAAARFLALIAPTDGPGPRL